MGSFAGAFWFFHSQHRWVAWADEGGAEAILHRPRTGADYGMASIWGLRVIKLTELRSCQELSVSAVPTN